MPRGISIQRDARASPTLRKTFTTCSMLASWRRPISAVVNSGSNLIAPRLKDMCRSFLSLRTDVFQSTSCSCENLSAVDLGCSRLNLATNNQHVNCACRRCGRVHLTHSSPHVSCTTKHLLGETSSARRRTLACDRRNRLDNNGVAMARL